MFHLPLLAGVMAVPVIVPPSVIGMAIPSSERWGTRLRQMMTVRARCGEAATVIVKMYRQTVWLSVEPFYNSEAILDPIHVDSLVDTLTQAAPKARSYQQ